MVIGTSRCAHVLRYLFSCRGASGTLAPLAALTCSNTAVVFGEPVMRSARTNARRRIAACKHSWSGCTQAPRPGSFPAGSTVTVHAPFPSSTATTRSSSTASSRFRQPTHVRTGPTGESVARTCSAAEVSRWITAESTVTVPAKRNGSTCSPRLGWTEACPRKLRGPATVGTSCRGALPAPHRGWARACWRARHRCGCRSASRSTERPAGRSAPPCR